MFFYSLGFNLPIIKGAKLCVALTLLRIAMVSLYLLLSGSHLMQQVFLSNFLDGFSLSSLCTTLNFLLKEIVTC